ASQQFRIDSESIRDKLNTLLPSQSRGSIGVDLSGSTTIIPVVDLTETAEGGAQREDLQKAFTLINTIDFDVENTTTTIANTPGFYKVVGNLSSRDEASGAIAVIEVTDGITTKILANNRIVSPDGTTAVQSVPVPFDLMVKLVAGDTLQARSNNAEVRVQGIARQIADVSGNLINP
uniref:Capsid Protein n=2 Tax=unidentified TaxID=32644 RepID=UPI00027B2C70|nr:Chain A, Capsid Protein [unidentified]4DMI_B Chain B, Capsid Protein [unidentified]4DMI_C Chain C, Capsid Protein [unidentified]4DMI_D Chain D, Capsid Protein [unidentified]4DMI_E Chain E, Capsid Protein [unidentified]